MAACKDKHAQNETGAKYHEKAFRCTAGVSDGFHRLCPQHFPAAATEIHPQRTDSSPTDNAGVTLFGFARLETYKRRGRTFKAL